MRPRFSIVLASVPLAATLALAAAPPPPQRTYLDDVLDRAALYVVRYEKECSAVVAEEHYVQDLKAPGRPQGSGGAVGDAHPGDDRRFWDNGATSRREKAPTGPTHRELVSDVLMVQLPDQNWFGFRDVAIVDGHPVRDRQDRVQALFLKSRAGLRQIQEESARYNIGHIQRTMNLPTFALAYLHPGLRDRFAFERAGEETIDGARTIVVAFVEESRPTIISNGRGRDIPSAGRIWVDPQSGRVLRTLLVAGDATSDVRAESIVTYRPHPEWGLLLPAEMRETYDEPARPEAYRVVCQATYGNFRRFSVTVDEKVQVPK
jgi:hypothetical protein